MQKPNTKNTDQKLKTEFKTRVYVYTVKFLRFSKTIKVDGVNKIILNQLIRSLTSIGANIVEAKACNSKKDFARYFDIALKSANETKYWLFLLRDTEDTIDKIIIQELIDETIDIANILASSLLTMRNKNV